MDIATIIGIVLGFGAMLLAVILEGGSPAALASTSAAVIVFGGTFGTLFISFSLESVLTLPKVLALGFKQQKHNTAELIELLVQLADKARREGLLALESEEDRIDSDYMRKGLRLVVDGVDSHVVREIMETDSALMAERHKAGYSMLDSMGGFAPTMGIIGTVMGLVNVLSNLSDPEHLGEAIAVAFLATLYGVGIANLLFLPLGTKLKSKSAEEQLVHQVILEGVLAIQAGQNARLVQEKLEAFLAPAKRGMAASLPSGESAPAPQEETA
ncbi:MAG: flagellar motor protein [Chloroflexi bacterium]|nr:flagellar motor protein [Chloroflexota bacterium]